MRVCSPGFSRFARHGRLRGENYKTKSATGVAPYSRLRFENRPTIMIMMVFAVFWEGSMPQSLLDKLSDVFHQFAGNGLHYVLPAAVAVIVLWIAWRLIRRRRRVPVPPSPI